MTPRASHIGAISNALGHRSLTWFGIRGQDALPYDGVPGLAGCFAITAPAEVGTTGTTLEQLSRRRVDLDEYDIDLDTSVEARTIRRALFEHLRMGSAVVSYRPSRFVEQVGLATGEPARLLGTPRDRQRAFEYKPWVETEIAAAGLPTIPWRYYSQDNVQHAAAAFRTGPQVIRANGRSGGIGIQTARSIDALSAVLECDGSPLVAVGPLIDPAVPVNVGACVYPGGTISVHPASVQLVGIPSCTSREFGYCGNDFGAFSSLDQTIRERTDQMAVAVGKWLWSKGYLGAFGVDLIVSRQKVLFAEVNARMQGSSALSSVLAHEAGLVDIALDHLGACLNLDPPQDVRLRDWTTRIPRKAQIIVHNTTTDSLTLQSQDVATDLPVLWELQLLPDPGVRVDPGGVLFRLVTDSSVTDSGSYLTADAEHLIADLKRGWVSV